MKAHLLINNTSSFISLLSNSFFIHLVNYFHFSDCLNCDIYYQIVKQSINVKWNKFMYRINSLLKKKSCFL